MVCLASICSTERMTVDVHALSVADSPLSTCSGAHGESSPFSAMQQEYLAGVPGVAWSSACGRSPNALIEPSRMARPIVALARNPEPYRLPRELSPIAVRTGPFTTVNGAVPVVACQSARDTPPSPRNESQAASTTGKYDGRQPARAALIAASRTVSARFRCGRAMTTSDGARAVVARISARYASVTGTTGSPSVQPREA